LPLPPAPGNTRQVLPSLTAPACSETISLAIFPLTIE
jgi:hypothetical protein